MRRLGQIAPLALAISEPAGPNSDPYAWARDVRGQRDLKPRTKVVAQVIAEYWNRGKGFAWPSRQSIADRAAVSLRTVDNALADLRRAGWIPCDKVRYRGTSQIYLCHPMIFRHCTPLQDSDDDAQPRTPLQVNGATPCGPAPHTFADEVSIEESSDEPNGALEEKATCNAGAPAGHALRLWPDCEERLPAVVDARQQRSVLCDAIRKALGRPEHAPEKEIWEDARRLPDHLQIMTREELAAGDLTLSKLADALVRYGAIQRIAGRNPIHTGSQPFDPPRRMSASCQMISRKS